MSFTLSNLITEVMPAVIGCPQPLVEIEARNVLADFCGSSGIVTQGFKKDVLSTDPATPNDHIDITTPTGMALWVPCDVLFLAIDGIPYEAKKRKIEDDLDDMDLIEEPGVKFWYPSTTTNIVMYPFEALAVQLYLQVAFKPSALMPAATALDTMFYEDWHVQIAAGIRARLLAMPKTVWQDKTMAGYYQGIYDEGVHAARISALNARDLTVSRNKNQHI